MRLVHGRTLEQALADRDGKGRLPWNELLPAFATVCDAMAYAHSRGVIHRDLKPSNIMVTPEGVAKVLDLGLAMRLDEELPTDKTIVGGQGYVVGTMDYIAPEQAEDPTAVGPLADLYSLGCSLYFALTGRPPFPGGTSVQKIMKHRTARPDPIEELNPDVPSEFARLVRRFMAKDPSRRPASADAARELLLPWAAPEPPASPAAGSETAVEILDGVPTASVWDGLPALPLADSPRRPATRPHAGGWFGRLFGGG
jgi:serine/threonine protein kinase